jgi:hypothetical protein
MTQLGGYGSWLHRLSIASAIGFIAFAGVTCRRLRIS